jgi:hypothetical protein
MFRSVIVHSCESRRDPERMHTLTFYTLLWKQWHYPSTDFHYHSSTHPVLQFFALFHGTSPSSAWYAIIYSGFQSSPSDRPSYMTCSLWFWRYSERCNWGFWSSGIWCYDSGEWFPVFRRNKECFVDHLTPKDEGTTYLRNVVSHSPIAIKRHIPEDRNPWPFHSFPQFIQANFQLVGLNGSLRGALIRISEVGRGRGRTFVVLRDSKSGFGPRGKNVGYPTCADLLIGFTLNWKEWLSVAEGLGLGLKGLFCTLDR